MRMLRSSRVAALERTCRIIDELLLIPLLIPLKYRFIFDLSRFLVSSLGAESIMRMFLSRRVAAPDRTCRIIVNSSEL